MRGIQLRLLGAVEVTNGTAAVDLGGIRPIRILLALYAAEARRLDLSELADRCFDAADRLDDPVPAIRTAVRRVRRALGDDAVKTRSGGYELDLDQIDVDIDRFEERLAAGRSTSDPVAAVTYFRQALDAWGGEPFGTHGDVPWLDLERFRLEEAHLMALEGWHDAHLRNGTVTEILPTLESTAKSHPLRERFQRQLMEALYLADRQADALRAFQAHRGALADAGLEPSDAILALEQRIVVGDPALRSADRGRPLRGYRILERLGEGAFSIVYRGNQPSVERDVAIKQIRAELANRPEFIRRFDAEAHMVARLEHPYIVPLYDYWREPGSAYLVMRLLRGGSLESALLEGPIPLEQTRRMVGQIGSALTVAHRLGIVHRDVKSANILLDDEGNAYLTDFGIALEALDRLDPEAALSAGSPAYASPEQLRREPVGPEADVHGLGIAVFESLTGRLPFPDEPDQASLLQRQLNDPIPSARNARAGLPPDLDAVLQRATAKRAADRYQSVDEFVDAFEAAFAGGPAPSPTPGSMVGVVGEERNPFKGLRAFTEADATDFAGRARLVDQLVQAVADHRLVAVVGPSGSGKSSVVRAGLLPALRGGAVPGSANWFVATLLPGAHPHEELEAALVRISTQPVAGLLQVLNEGDRGLSRALRQTLPEDAELLLVIDQFEEIFTLCDDEATRRQLLDALAAAVSEERSRLRIVLTLRADFYDRPLRYESIGRLVRDATMPVLPLAADELERAIVDPADAVGCQMEPGLVSEIVADVSDQPGALPMLQYALTELYERRVSGMLTRSAYRELGGVTGALAAKAEDLFAESTADEQVQLRRLFGRLVTFGEGTEDTRRRVLRTEFGTGVGDAVIARFGAARLLSFDRDPVSREPTVEVAHEALIRAWPRLKAWLGDDRDGLRIHRHLTETARAWETSGRDDGELYRSGRLEAAEAWADEHGTDLNAAEQAFLAASLDRRAAEQDAEARTNRRLRRLLVGVGVVALVALVAGAFAFVQRGRANDQAAAAEQSRAAADTERIAAESVTQVDDNPQLALLLAAEAHRRDPGTASMGALQQVLTSTGSFLGVVGAGNSYTNAGWLDDTRVAAAGSSGVAVWDVTTGEQLLAVDLPVATSRFDIGGDSSVTKRPTAAFGGGLAAVLPEDDLCCLSIVDLATGEVARSTVEHDRVDAVAMTEQGLIATLDKAGTLRLFDNEATLVWETTAHPEATYSEVYAAVSPPADTSALILGLDEGPIPLPFFGGVAFNADATELATSQYGIVRHWDVATGAPSAPDEHNLWTADGKTILYRTYLLSYTDSDELLTGSETFLGLGANAVELQTTGPWFGMPNAVALHSLDDGTALVQFSDRRLAIVDPLVGEVAATSFALSLPDPGLAAVSLNSDRVAVPSADGIGIWSLAGEGLIAEAFPRRGAHVGSISADGQRLTAMDVAYWFNPALDAPMTHIDLATGESLPLPEAVDEYTYSYFGDSPTLYSWGEDFRVTAYDQETFAELGSLEQIGANGFTVSETAGYAALGAGAGVQIFPLDGGPHVAELELGSSASSISFNADGTRVAAALGDVGTMRVWDTETWEVMEDGSNVAGFVRALRYDPNGRYLVTVDNDGVLTLRDPLTHEPIDQLIGSRSDVLDSDLWFSEDGRLMLSGGFGAVRLWDLESRTQVGGTFPNDPGFRIGGNDGPALLTAVDDWLLVWNLHVDAWADIACHAAGRNMTLAEWDRFGPADEEYRATCPQWELAEAS